MTDKNPLSVAIVGGGIAGVTLTIALLQKCPHMQVTLYESASAFGEIGAGVGFQPVMVRTMNLIDPRIGAAFDKCSKGNDDVYDPPLWFRMRVGDERKEDVKLGEQIFELPARKGPRGGVHRAHFLDELVKLVPEGVAQFKKKLVDVAEGEDDDVLLKFADGSTARHSVVLGCDGIKSRTRPIVLKGDSEAAKAVFSGKYAYRGVLPMEKALEILGESARDPQIFMGYHGHVLTFPIANGKMFNVVAFSSKPTWGDPNWVVSTSREDMLEDYKHWSPAVRAIMDSLQKPDIWALFNHPPAPTYYTTKPLICLVGDAAHASTPHQGAGAGMCIEDAYILSELLSQCHTKSDLQKAFYAYDAVRRPRTQKLVKTSREAGMLWDFEGEGIGDDLEALEKNATTRMSWIWDHEILGDLAMAKDMMAEA
ncbi:mannitol 1-phosphate dehydrogenase [Pyrenophora tritici-repentis]|uniref:Mannitol 1-phosphate dehydrogenase n=1 Tax=Pyrenophora tritici-repentis TaxID=45151 RepID=A0A2W1D9V1_9PLEO|nr:Mannitol 1-phosphate dehydrogenase [Pyrenophora tritici-repentis]KAG9381179.1 Mannitol 1-phosphate dehydrogenase [Pyrenophora tritici-repentis]KAI0581860.1 Mannitol 1-phosphate dehydrogenase [Pyrenophora tritici-repentis]KAI0583869.1 Mannitol 1-phosphate dehydrogenase [Pyrenophora tritici-repentis]KAI0604743.1 Mannitol 1-phosphate dehydrogenase [Pyrenophora tritici-repentis]